MQFTQINPGTGGGVATNPGGEPDHGGGGVTGVNADGVPATQQTQAGVDARWKNHQAHVGHQNVQAPQTREFPPGLLLIFAAVLGALGVT